MNEKHDNHYYLLGRDHGFIELRGEATKPKPHGIGMKQMMDWQQGYEEAVATYYWRRKPVNKRIPLSI